MIGATRYLTVLLALCIMAAPAWAAHRHSSAVRSPVSATPGSTLPAPLGQFNDWSAYSAGSGGAKTCYALAQPQSSDPAKAHRAKIFFLISDWPAQKIKAQAEAVPGYPYMKDSVTTVQIGSDKFNFFTKNDGNGSAWLQNKADETRLIASMQRATQMTVTGTSARGTVTHDTYSLAGLSDALAKAHAGCGM